MGAKGSGRLPNPTKICTGKYSCGEEKPQEAFDKNCAYCIDCRKKRIKKQAARYYQPEIDLELRDMINACWRITND